MPPDKATDEESLRRLGGGRWQTRDERFTIEPQSGTWAIVDAEQTDELGLPLVRGPYPSLTAAKAAIAGARGSAAPTSPLKERPKPAPAPSESSPKGSARTAAKATTKPARANKAEGPDEPAEPKPAPLAPLQALYPQLRFKLFQRRIEFALGVYRSDRVIQCPGLFIERQLPPLDDRHAGPQRPQLLRQVLVSEAHRFLSRRIGPRRSQRSQR